jgi:hypothetical protein
MPATTVHRALDDPPFAGRTSSVPWTGPLDTLKRRTVDANGDTCWFWTRQAETALDMNALNQSVEGRQN